MSKRRTIILSAALVLCLATQSVASDLDKAQLKSGIASRVDHMIAQQSGNDPARQPVTEQNVHLKQVESVSVTVDGHDISLYAVKAGLKFPDGATDDIMMIVDASGKLQFSVNEVDTGKSPFQAAQDRLQKAEIDPALGTTVYKGSGEKELVLASSPFCSYCREAVSYFLAHRDLLSEWRIVHMAYEGRIGNNTAVWAIRDGMETVNPLEILAFAYMELEPVAEETPGKVSEKIITQFMDRFPELKEKWGTAEQARYFLKGKYEDETRQEAQIAATELSVQATPQAFIDGIPVAGWAPDRYADLLDINEKESKERRYGQR